MDLDWLRVEYTAALNVGFLPLSVLLPCERGRGDMRACDAYRCASHQDVYFAKGMANMHLLYAHDTTWSLRIEDLTPGLHDRPGPELPGTAKVFYLPDNAVTDVALAELRDTDETGSCGAGCHFGCSPPCPQLHRNSTPYLQRGWCRAEVQWSLARTAPWKSIRIPFREGRNSEAPMAPAEFRAQAERGTLKFTHRSDLEPVLQLQAQVFHEKAAEATELVLVQLPEAQVQVMARALPHYERLEEVEVGKSELAGEAFQAASLPFFLERKTA